MSQPPDRTGLPHGSPVPQGAEVRSIVILRALYLGDLLLSAPAWRALRRRYPRAGVTLIGLPWAEALTPRLGGLVDELLHFPGFPGIPELPYDPGRTAAFLAEQQARGYDLALQMHGDGTSSNGFVAALGARVSLGYARPGDERLTVRLPYEDGQHETARWLRLVGALGAPMGETRPLFALTAADHAAAAELLGPPDGAPLVALHPGAKDPARRWPARKFAVLGAALRQHYGARLVLTGTAAEAGLTGLAWGQLGGRALDLAGRTELGVFAALLSRADLLVSNDTGASHLAAATGTPSVVLYGPSRPGEYAPLDGARHRVLDALEHGPDGEDPAIALRRLPVEAVLHACIAQLGTWRSARTRARAVGGEEGVWAG